MADAVLDCNLDNEVELTLTPKRGVDPAKIEAGTVVFLTDPEHAGEFTQQSELVWRFKPNRDGPITVAVAAKTASGAILKDWWKLNVHGVEADTLNLAAKVIDARVETGQGPKA